MKKQLIKEFFKKSPVAYSLYKIILDENGVPNNYQFIDINEQFENMIGLKAEEIIGKTFKELYPQYYECEQKWIKMVGKASLEEKNYEVEIYSAVIKKHLRAVIFSIDKQYSVAMFEYASKEYLKQNQIEGFLKANIDLLCVTDREGNFIKVNKEFEKVLGYKGKVLKGKNFISLIHKEYIVEAMELIHKQKTKFTFVNKYLCKNGRYKNIEWCALLEDKYIFFSGRDITEKIEVEKELKNINSELVKLTEKLKQKNDKLENIANTDRLTSLYNRHFFEKIIEKKIEKADARNETISLIIFDIDHFKRVNDNWGHPIGDKVLKETAVIVKNTIRNTDILFRWGGEEFIILMPKTNLSEAIFIAEKIRKKIEKNVYEEVGHLTCSFGVADRGKNELFKKWYQKADQALYSAKSNGRNCVFSPYDKESKAIVNMNFQWKADWESGNRFIDEQHYEILEIANKLINMSLSNCNHKKLINELELFSKSLEKHFLSEEEVLNKIGYPDIKEHSELHKELTRKNKELKQYCETGRFKNSDLFEFLVNVIMEFEQDIPFFSYVRQVIQYII